MSEPFDTPSIAPALQELLALFTSELEEVRFPGVDAQTLGVAAEAVREAARALTLAEAAAEVARERLTETQEALLARGQRALAYARIFAEEDPALWARLESVQLPRSLRRGGRRRAGGGHACRPRRRGRPPKNGAPWAPSSSRSRQRTRRQSAPEPALLARRPTPTTVCSNEVRCRGALRSRLPLARPASPRERQPEARLRNTAASAPGPGAQRRWCQSPGARSSRSAASGRVLARTS